VAANPRAVAKALIRASNVRNGGDPAAGGFGSIASAMPSGQQSPLVASYGDWASGRALGRGLPRDPATFLAGSFGPLAPMQPVPIDNADPDTGRVDPRRWQYPVSWNMPHGVPGDEGLKLASFANLRVIGQSYSVARACIQLRKSELLGLGWDVVPTKTAEKAMRSDPSARKEFEVRRAKMLKFWRRPDQQYFSFRDWFAVLLEDVLVIDALSLYLWPSKRPGKGVLGSDLGQLAAVDGATIRPLVDVHGATPLPPNPAYQQYLFGVPRTDLVTMQGDGDVAGMQDVLQREYRADRLIYRPSNPQVWTPYGLSCIEQALVPILSGIQRQQFQLDFFSEGTIPGLFISAGDPNATPNQLRELQDALNAMAGDPAWKHKIIVLPQGSRTDPQRPAELAGTFDEIIMTQVCMAFSVMPMELGITPRSSSSGHSGGAANQMGKLSTDAQDRKANLPLLEWFSDIFNHVIQAVCGQEDMQWWWEGLEADEDENTKTEIQAKKVSIGLMSVDEARIENGVQPWGLPTTSDPVLITPTGVIPFGSIDPSTGQPEGLTAKLTAAPPPPGTLPGQQPQPSDGQPSGQPPEPSAGKPTPGQQKPTPAHAGAQATKAADPDGVAGDVDVEALLVAMDRIRPARINRAWDPDLHPRIPRGMPGAGRFIALVDHHHDRLVAHLEGRGHGDPFDGFSREQLRRVARRRGVGVESGASREEVSGALLSHLRDTWHVPEPTAEPTTPPLPDGVTVAEHSSGRLHVHSPYDRAFVAGVKALGGTWLPKSKSWSVPGSKAAKLDGLIRRVYGGDSVVSTASLPDGVSVRTRPNGKIEVTSPYNAAFVKDARNVGGAWDPSAKAWIFPPHREAAARELAARHYGAEWAARQKDAAEQSRLATVARRSTTANDTPRSGSAPATDAQKRLIRKMTANWGMDDWRDLVEAPFGMDVRGDDPGPFIASLTVNDASHILDELVAEKRGW
jgi:hypothetical protein